VEGCRFHPGAAVDAAALPPPGLGRRAQRLIGDRCVGRIIRFVFQPPRAMTIGP